MHKSSMNSEEDSVVFMTAQPDKPIVDGADELLSSTLDVINAADEAGRSTTGLADDKYTAHQTALIRGFTALIQARERKAERRGASIAAAEVNSELGLELTTNGSYYLLRHHGGTDLAATSSVAASDASNPPKQQGSNPTERKDV